MNVEVSLIMATLNRKIEVEKMLSSLSKQTYKNFEVIIVDQNEENFLENIIKSFDSLNIKHIRIDKKGLSLARNIGLNYIEGKIVGFPDDDCQYKEDTLEEVVRFFYKNKEVGAVTGKLIRDINEKKGNKVVFVNKYSIWKKGISFTMFFRKNVVDEIGEFDEVLGVGSGTPFGSGEETDYMIRIIERKIPFCNTDKILVYHPDENWNNPSNPDIYKKIYSYTKGRIYVLKKHKYSPLYILGSRCFTIIKMLRYFYNSKRRKRYYYEFKGKL